VDAIAAADSVHADGRDVKSVLPMYIEIRQGCHAEDCRCSKRRRARLRKSLRTWSG